MRRLVSDARSAVTALGDALSYRHSFEVRVETAQVLQTLTAMLDAASGADTTLTEVREHLQMAAKHASGAVGDVSWDSRRGRWVRP